MSNETKTLEFQVIADFPWSMHKIGDIIKVYESTCRAYVVQVPDYGDGPGESEKFDLRDFPFIYRQVSDDDPIDEWGLEPEAWGGGFADNN